jgi:hypothetical protein
MASRIPGNGGTVKLNFKGMNNLLKSVEVTSMLQQRMARVQAAIPGSQMETRFRTSRTAVKVIHGSDYDEANTGNLSRALDLAGGSRGTKPGFGASSRNAKAKRGL